MALSHTSVAAAVQSVSGKPAAQARPAERPSGANLGRLVQVPMRAKRSGLAPPYTIIPYNSLDIGRFIGEGSFAKVYKAIYEKALQGGGYRVISVAVKFYPEKFKADFDREVAVLTPVANDNDGFNRHPNLVGFYGAGYDVTHSCYHLVLEYMREGSLQSYLSKMTEGLRWPTLLKAAIGIAAGLVDLHAMGFISRDIKSANILLGDDKFNQIKLADFGITIKAKDSKKEIQGSPYYMAPEIITGIASQASDVYSFGVVLLEMLSPALFRERTHKVGYKQWLANIPENISVLEKRILGSVKFFGARAGEQKDFFDNILLKCIDADPAKRPTMHAVFDKLKKLQQAYSQRVNATQVKFAGLSALVSYSQFKPPTELSKAVEEPTRPYVKLESISFGYGVPKLGCF